jgi:hypothetical protein
LLCCNLGDALHGRRHPRSYHCAPGTERIARNPAQQPYRRRRFSARSEGFPDVERKPLLPQAEKDGLMPEAIVTLLLASRTARRRAGQPHLATRPSASPFEWIEVIGKGDKHRRVPLNAEARKALEAIQPTPAAVDADAVFPGNSRCSLDAQWPAMSRESVLYDDFNAARRDAIALTDQYLEAAPGDPARAELWERAMLRTETARLLLDKWLSSPSGSPALPGLRRWTASARPNEILSIVVD